MLPLWHRRVSRYIDSIILNGLIKCILNNTKLEKKKKGTTNCIYSVLRKCCYSFNFICDIIIIFPPFHARGRAREPSVNTADGSEVPQFPSPGGWGAGTWNRGAAGWAGPGWGASADGLSSLGCWKWLPVAPPETGKQSISLENGFLMLCLQASAGPCPVFLLLSHFSCWIWTKGFVLWWLCHVAQQCHLPGTH